jgi:hypothetical protein
MINNSNTRAKTSKPYLLFHRATKTSAGRSDPLFPFRPSSSCIDIVVIPVILAIDRRLRKSIDDGIVIAASNILRSMLPTCELYN